MKRITYNGIELALLLALLGLPAGAQDQAASSPQTSSSDSSSLGTYARQVRKDPEAKNKPKVFDNDNLPKDDKLSIVGAPAGAPDDNAVAKPEEAAAPPSDAKTQSEAKTDGQTETKTETKADAKTDTPADTKADAKSEGQTETKADAKPEAKAPAPTQAPGQVAPAAAATSESASADSGPKTPEQEQAAKEAKWKQAGEKLDSQKEQIDLINRELEVLQKEYQLRAAAMYGDVGNRLRNQADWDKQDAQYKQQIADKQKALEDARQKLDDMQEDARKDGVPASVREP
jgi:hypothetical protein